VGAILPVGTLGLFLTVDLLATVYSEQVFALGGGGAGGAATGTGTGKTANGIGVGASDVTKANANNTNSTSGKGGVATLNTTSGIAKRP